MISAARRRATAFHEAGHAVVSVVERVPITVVTAVEEGDALGSCGHRPWPVSIRPDLDTNRRTTNRILKQIRVLFAGVIAEARSKASKRWNQIGFQWDRDVIGDLVLYIAHDSAHASEICDAERRHTEELVRTHWHAIGLVAAALLDQGHLSGARVREVVRPTLRTAS